MGKMVNTVCSSNGKETESTNLQVYGMNFQKNVILFIETTVPHNLNGRESGTRSMIFVNTFYATVASLLSTKRA